MLPPHHRARALAALATAAALTACGSAATDPVAAPPEPPPSITATAAATTAAPTTAAPTTTTPPAAAPTTRTALRTTSAPRPAGGRPPGSASARAVDTSRPTRTIGDGTPASCTSGAVVDAVAAGGIITFACGPEPVVITLTETAKVVNANGPRIVLDGGGLVTLSGGGARRILYLNTCDQAQGWTTSHCNDQADPQLTVQNLAFVDGDSTGQTVDGGGGGAIFVRGGTLTVVNSRFLRNRCDGTGPDLGGAAIRVLDQYRDEPVHVVESTFEGGVCSNGGALSSIGVSWVVLDSVFTGNSAVGSGANPARDGSPGGGSGGAIYTDGNRFTVTIEGSRIEGNDAREGGGAIFFVSNDRTGELTVRSSTLRRNPSAGFETFPGIFFLGAGEPELG